ncbi:MAG: DUF4157 domain-containing protein [Nostoc sp.]|uniref:eCIS core domain-containing protein n=1 Tax=Nostoc sp. TaxID=1180 RepID=UPI002FFD00D8
MNSKRIAQTNQQQKSEKPQESGILQRAAVRSVSQAEVQSTDDKEPQSLSNSALSKNFSRVPISTTEPQQIMAKLKLSPVMQLMRPHEKDVSRYFHILVKDSSTPSVGMYIGPVGNNKYKFSTSEYGDVELIEEKIVGYRPTVGQIHPPNTQRSMEDRLNGRSVVLLSAGDLSEPMARQRRDPNLAQNLAATTFGELEYQSYSENAENLARLGVPILNNVDLSKEEDVRRLNNIATGSQIHFQMPRVPQGTPGYSTQKLVKDTLTIPQTLKRSDLKVSITAPDPSMYQSLREHNRNYGLESEKALVNTGMERTKTDVDSDLEEFGYTHKQTTVDSSTKVAEKRKKYFFESGQGEAIQRQEMSEVFSDGINTSWVQKENKTGLPDNLKDGIQNLSGMAMDDVRVHYHSPKPAQLQALAYTQGTEIHVGPGQERHLPHEVWHVVQQAQGRVKPTMQMKNGIPVNDDKDLEDEADVMGAKATQLSPKKEDAPTQEMVKNFFQARQLKQVVQLGGGPKPSEVGLMDAEEVHKHGNFVIFYGKKQDGHSYVEALVLEAQTTVCAAYVQVITKGKSVTLHTKAESKYQGGIGSAILPVAIATLATKHVKDDSTVTLPMGGAAVIKLLVEKLSKILGNPDIHSVADLKKQYRKTQEKTENDGSTILDTDVLDKKIAQEHKLHMQSLLNSEKGKRLSFTSYGRKVVESNATDREFNLEQYIDKIATDPSQLFIDIPGNLFLEFAKELRG